MRIVFCRLGEEFRTISMMMVRRSLGCERRLDAFRVSKFQCTIHFIGRDVIEHLALIFFRKGFPIFLRCLKQCQRTHYVCPGENERIFNRPVHMDFSCQMDYAIDIIINNQFLHQIIITDVPFHKSIVGRILYVIKICKVACISQFVKVYDAIIRILFHKEPYNVRPDESCSTVIIMFRFIFSF